METELLKVILNGLNITDIELKKDCTPKGVTKFIEIDDTYIYVGWESKDIDYQQKTYYLKEEKSMLKAIEFYNSL